jgi:hypothetical protein
MADDLNQFFAEDIEQLGMLITAKGSFAGAMLRVFRTISKNEAAADYRVPLLPSVVSFDAVVGSRRS